MEMQSKGGLVPTKTLTTATSNTSLVMSTNQSQQLYTPPNTLSPIKRIINVIPPSQTAATTSHSFAQAFLVIWVLVALLALVFNCIQIAAIFLKAKRSRRKKLKG